MLSEGLVGMKKGWVWVVGSKYKWFVYMLDVLMNLIIYEISNLDIYGV